MPPADHLAHDRPAHDRPASDRPASDRPAPDRPAPGGPASDRPAPGRPADGPPAGGAPGPVAPGAPADGRLARGAAAAAALVEAAVSSGRLPGAVLAVGSGADGEPVVRAFGRTAVHGPSAPVTPDTVYDLASLTKVTATLPAVLRLVDEGAVGLDDPVRRHLPGFTGPGKDRVTVRHLLAHSSGLPPHRPLHELPGAPADRLAAALAEPLATAPGTAVAYSDLGFLALGEVVRTAAGAPLDRAVAELVLDPLGMDSTRYLPPAPWLPRTAATEPGADGVPKAGVVHDENAESLGGVCGHAGLFGTAPDLARYLRRCWLDPDGPVLSRAVRAEALRCQTAGLDGRRGLGWTLRGDRWDHMAAHWPATGAGHTGFTGTALALDPVSGLWAVLLTNAVHLGREASTVVALRRAVSDALAGAALAEGTPAEDTSAPGPSVRARP
ncbi:beta-lactamase family protein [Streptacidiphilus sp. ASG 303]|uniref:serine hydrolase domain-containing protein n=1 Tax=Streptacidiphilus sp. ASG 303 TaxID=2896847 RepID=UPI001E4AA8B2|nr:serine hydrolase domain-containing protein [Streptacidiphilus sp. ASG 303]MCD0481037.1 beta-lactamase family protein [Streptacidiphilus sp. ASG 303]